MAWYDLNDMMFWHWKRGYIIMIICLLFKIFSTRSWENVSYAICERQSCRSACTSTQPDCNQHLCCSDSITPLLPNIQCFKTLARICTWAGWYESYLVANPWRHFYLWHGSNFRITMSRWEKRRNGMGNWKHTPSARTVLLLKSYTAR